MKQLVPFTQQSNYDLALEGYGTLDFFIKLLSDNLVNISSALNKTYQIDSEIKGINTNNTGLSYATKNNIIGGVGGIYGDAYGDSYS
jgi:hypothetical protein